MAPAPVAAAASDTKRPQRSGVRLTPLLSEQLVLSTPPSSPPSTCRDSKANKNEAAGTVRRAWKNRRQRTEQQSGADRGPQRPQTGRRRALRAIFQDAGSANEAPGDADAATGASISGARAATATEKQPQQRALQAEVKATTAVAIERAPTSQDRKRAATTLSSVSLASSLSSCNDDLLVNRKKWRRRLHTTSSSPALLPEPSLTPGARHPGPALCRSMPTSVMLPLTASPSLRRHPASEQTSSAMAAASFPHQTILPTVHSSDHPDLHVVTPQTVARLVRGDFRSQLAGYKLLDCRFSYEFQGGSLRGASSLSDPDTMEIQLFRPAPNSLACTRTALVFFCEFSANRAPKMLRHVRNLDRRVHADRYPELFFPELYLILGGYKNCFETLAEEICSQPPAYVTMEDVRFVDVCRREFAAWRRRWKPHKTVAACAAKFHQSQQLQDADIRRLQNSQSQSQEAEQAAPTDCGRARGSQHRELPSHGIRSLFEEL